MSWKRCSPRPTFLTVPVNDRVNAASILFNYLNWKSKGNSADALIQRVEPWLAEPEVSAVNHVWWQVHRAFNEQIRGNYARSQRIMKDTEEFAATHGLKWVQVEIYHAEVTALVSSEDAAGGAGEAARRPEPDAQDGPRVLPLPGSRRADAAGPRARRRKGGGRRRGDRPRQRATRDADPAPGDVPAALALYRGHFLALDAPVPWTLPPRDRLQARLVRAVLAAGDALERQGEWSRARALYERALDVDNLAEAIYRRLMVCLREAGDAAGALTTYRRCRELLSIVLGRAPSPETEAVRQTLQ